LPRKRQFKKEIQRIADDHFAPGFAKISRALPVDAQRIDAAIRKALGFEGSFVLSFLLGRLMAVVGPDKADELLSSLIAAISERPD
jgi:hypothetical protein